MNNDRLFLADGSPWNTAATHLLIDYPYNSHNLLVALRFTVVKESPFLIGLLDTAATWVILPESILTSLQIAVDTSLSLKEKMSSRFGVYEGYLNRLPLNFIAESGDSLQIEATCFISGDWPGPPVIGWKGCLERIRFAIDPSLNRFYFGALAG